jgi:hypothetical protein
MILLLALLLQTTAKPPQILMHTERIEFSTPELILHFYRFTRADMIEIVPAGKQEDPGIGVASAAVRNLIVQHRNHSYTVEVTPERRRTVMRFQPADVRQDAVLIVTAPEGTRLTIATDDITTLQRRDFREAVFIHDGRVEEGLNAAALNTLHERVAKGSIVLPAIAPFNSAPRVIHTERPELERDELQTVRRLLDGKRTAAVFEATVTDTGQVIDVLQTSALPVRLPRSIMRKLEEAAMRFSYEPQVVNGKAQSFTTSIVLEIPQ